MDTVRIELKTTALQVQSAAIASDPYSSQKVNLLVFVNIQKMCTKINIRPRYTHVT